MYYRLKADAGAVGDGSTDDAAKIRDWFIHGCTTGQPLAAENSHYKINSPLTFDYNTGKGLNGVTMLGSGKQQTLFDARSVTSGTPFNFIASGGQSPQNGHPQTALYSKIVDFGFLGDLNGAVVRVGKGDISDNLGVMEIDAWVGNPNAGAGVMAIDINFLIQSIVKVTANCHNQYAGTAMALRYAQFNTFIACSLGSAAIDLYMHGETWGNEFVAPNFDACGTCLVIDDAKVKNNVFDAGHWAYYGNGVNATAGSENEIRRAHKAPFPGAGAFAANSVGVTII